MVRVMVSVVPLVPATPYPNVASLLLSLTNSRYVPISLGAEPPKPPEVSTVYSKYTDEIQWPEGIEIPTVSAQELCEFIFTGATT